MVYPHSQPKTAFTASDRSASSMALMLRSIFILCVSWAIISTTAYAQQHNTKRTVMPNDASRNVEHNTSTVYGIPETLDSFNDPAWHARDIRRFDVAGFERGLNNSERIVLSSGANIRQLKNGSPENYYQEDISRPDSPYTYFNVYDARGRLVMKAVDFYHLAIGNYLSYNAEGEVTHRRQANDGLFTYPISDLIVQMRTFYQLDLLDTRRIWLFSTAGEVPPFYYIIYAWPTSDGKVDTSHGLEGYLVDAGSGALVFHMASGIFITPDAIRGNPYQAYTESRAQETRSNIARNQQALEQASVLIKTFTDAPDTRNTVFDLRSAADVLTYKFSLDGIRTDPAVFTEQRRAWLELALQIIDLADRYNPPPLPDENDLANLCAHKVFPPLSNGVYYNAPIDPAEIKDLALRAQYEQAIADNTRKCLRMERLHTFRRLTGLDPNLDPKASFLASIQHFIVVHYRPTAIMDDRKELHALINQYLHSLERQQAMRGALAIPAVSSFPN